jgi:lipoate-protein ligase A
MLPLLGTRNADYKAPGGKLLRVRLRVENGIITAIAVMGDFFMHPEEAIEELECALIGAPYEANAVRAQTARFFESGVQVIGASVEDIVHVIMTAQ